MRIKYKMSKKNFTKHIGCNNNKIYNNAEDFMTFLYSTNIYESTILFVYKRNVENFQYRFVSYQHQQIPQ